MAPAALSREAVIAHRNLCAYQPKPQSRQFTLRDSAELQMHHEEWMFGELGRFIELARGFGAQLWPIGAASKLMIESISAIRLVTNPKSAFSAARTELQARIAVLPTNVERTLTQSTPACELARLLAGVGKPNREPIAVRLGTADGLTEARSLHRSTTPDSESGTDLLNDQLLVALENHHPGLPATRYADDKSYRMSAEPRDLASATSLSESSQNGGLRVFLNRNIGLSANKGTILHQSAERKQGSATSTLSKKKVIETLRQSPKSIATPRPTFDVPFRRYSHILEPMRQFCNLKLSGLSATFLGAAFQQYRAEAHQVLAMADECHFTGCFVLLALMRDMPGNPVDYRHSDMSLMGGRLWFASVSNAVKKAADAICLAIDEGRSQLSGHQDNKEQAVSNGGGRRTQPLTPQRTKEALPAGSKRFWFDEESCGSIFWHGEYFKLKENTQGKCVKLMWDAWKKGIPGVPVSEFRKALGIKKKALNVWGDIFKWSESFDFKKLLCCSKQRLWGLVDAPPYSVVMLNDGN